MGVRYVGHRHIAMGLGGRKFESSCAALQTQLRSEDGAALEKKKGKPVAQNTPGALRLQTSS